MNDFSNNFGSNGYSEYYEAGVFDPATDENLWIAVHAEGRGADVLPESQFPEGLGGIDQPFENYFSEAENAFVVAPSNGAYAIAQSATLAGHQGFLLSLSMQDADLSNPSFDDLPSYIDTMEYIGAEVARLVEFNDAPAVRAMAEAQGISIDEVHANLAEYQGLLVETIDELKGVVETDPGYAVLNAVSAGLEERGVLPQLIEQVFTIPENNNPDLGNSLGLTQPDFQ